MDVLIEGYRLPNGPAYESSPGVVGADPLLGALGRRADDYNG